MIETKADLRYYIAQDMQCNGIAMGVNSGVLRLRIDGMTIMQWLKVRINPRLRFTYNLRYYEYYHNQRKKYPWTRLTELYHYYVHKKLSYKLGYTIYANNFGPGLKLGHYGTIVINNKVRIGANCICHVCVNIGRGATVIGDNCYLGPGAKIIKAVRIGNNVQIGANAVVNKDIPDNCIVAGIPARIIKRLNPETGVWEKV